MTRPIPTYERGRLDETIEHLDRGDIDHGAAAYHLRRQVERLRSHLSDEARVNELRTEVRVLCGLLEKGDE